MFERNLARFAAARVASVVGGSGAARRSARCASPTSNRPSSPGPTGTVSAPPGRHLRLGPGHGGRPQLALLRGRRQLPLRPRPRGGGRTSRTPDAARSVHGAGARLHGRRHRAASARRAPRGAPADASGSPSGTSPRGCRSGSAPTPAAGGRPAASSPTRRNSTRFPTSLRRGCRDGRAHGVRRARGPRRRGRAGDTVAVLGAGTLGLAP